MSVSVESEGFAEQNIYDEEDGSEEMRARLTLAQRWKILHA